MIRGQGRAVLVGAFVAMIVGLLWLWGQQQRSGLVVHEPESVLGTTGVLAVRFEDADQQVLGETLRQVEGVLRRVEAVLGVDGRDISRLDRAPVATPVALDALTRSFIERARWGYDVTGGTVDLTIRPLRQLWDRGDDAVEPDAAAIATARAASTWDHLLVGDDGVERIVDTAGLDPTPLLRGFAIDRAIDHLIREGVDNALVEVGGAVRCLGAYEGLGWPIRVRAPWDGAALGVIHLRDRAVSLERRGAGPVIDPRNGRPVSVPPAVVVVAAEAFLADLWAAALAVQGEAGLADLPEGIDALVVLGTAEEPQLITSPGFDRWFQVTESLVDP